MFKRNKKTETKIGSAFESLLYYTFDENRVVDEQIAELADCLIANRPVVANLEDMTDVEESNRAIAFLSGVVYALEGAVYPLGKETFLFGTKIAYSDGTLYRYIKDVGGKL